MKLKVFISALIVSFCFAGCGGQSVDEPIIINESTIINEDNSVKFVDNTTIAFNEDSTIEFSGEYSSLEAGILTIDGIEYIFDYGKTDYPSDDWHYKKIGEAYEPFALLSHPTNPKETYLPLEPYLVQKGDVFSNWTVTEAKTHIVFYHSGAPGCLGLALIGENGSEVSFKGEEKIRAVADYSNEPSALPEKIFFTPSEEDKELLPRLYPSACARFALQDEQAVMNTLKIKDTPYSQGFVCQQFFCEIGVTEVTLFCAKSARANSIKIASLKNIENEYDFPRFSGKVDKVDGYSFYITPNEGEAIREQFDSVYVNKDYLADGSKTDFFCGDEVTVYYYGVGEKNIENAHIITLVSRDSKADDWKNAQSIDVSYAFKDRKENWTVKNENELTELRDWFNSLTLSRLKLAEGENIFDYPSWDIYTFNLNQPNGDTVTYTYGVFKKDWPVSGYIFCGGDWYRVQGMTAPFASDYWTRDFKAASYPSALGGYNKTTYPVITVITSTQEFDEYFSKYSSAYRKEYSKYTPQYFERNYLVMILYELNHVPMYGFCYDVDKISVDGDIFLKDIDPWGGGGAAFSYWDVFIELDNNFKPSEWNLHVEW